MNLANLFESQKKLRSHINYNEPDRFNKLILALLVEIGELANELPKLFKYWSHKKNNYKNALFEYVDGLHFVLELGIELDYFPSSVPGLYHSTKTTQFIELYYKVSELNFAVQEWGKKDIIVHDCYQEIFDYYLSLGKSLGFTWEQIEQAYYDKNRVNHERQDNGY